MARYVDSPPQQRSYSVEEVGEVIRTASSLASRAPGTALEVRERLGFQELAEVARELGIPEEALLEAIPEAEDRRRRAHKRTKRKMRFWRHLITYVIVMAGLGVIDWFAGPGWWVYIPASVWGIVLAMHGVRTFLTGRDGAMQRALYRRELEAESRSR